MIVRPEHLAPFARVVALLNGVKPRGDGFRARCPAHGDEDPSLDVDRGDDGRVLLICRSAGCSVESIVNALGLELRDLFVDGGKRAPPAPEKPPKRYASVEAVGQMFQDTLGGVLTVYPYRDAAGDTVGAALRLDHADKEKDIRQARRDGSEWLARGMLDPRPLYRLPELLAADREEPVLILEGEKKTDEVAALGFVVTTSCGGSPAPSKTDWSALAGRPVVILPDNDEPGRRYRDDVTTLVRSGGATSVSALELPGLAEGEDVADWIAARLRDGQSSEQIASTLRDKVTTACAMPVTAAATTPAAIEPASFPVDALPPVLRAMVTEGAAAQGVDVAYWAVPLLGILAGCVGATRRVRINTDWPEPVVVWSAVVAPSGSGKSPPLRALLGPVRDRDYELHQRTIALHQQHAVDLDAWKGTPVDERGPRPVPPPILAAMIDDATLEAVAARLVDNPRGLLLAVDELAGWLRGHDRYRSGGGDEQRWLSVHSATSFPIDRKGAQNGPARTYVRNPCVSIIGTIQPAIARKYLANPERRAAGVCARVLLAAPPITAAELTDRAIPTHVHDDYRRVIHSLLDLRLGANGEPVDVPLSPAAYSRFRVWHDRNGTACVDAAREGDEDIAAMLSKLRGYAPRIALELTLARAAENGVAAILDVVDEDAIVAAIAIVDFHEDQARRVYGQWSDDDATDQSARECGSLSSLAARFADILKSGPKDREDLRNATGRNIKAPRIDAALAILKANNRATMAMIRESRGGRPREVWTLVGSGVSA
ncbi:MAG: DUF3987 domain-containing protein [Planctomycetes bacterium]|nr:DUF3987 domain-containing protein [Planctomycetota bacterium]